MNTMTKNNINDYLYLETKVGKLLDNELLKQFNIKKILFDDMNLSIFKLEDMFGFDIIVTIRKYGTGVFKLLDIQ